MLRTIGKRLADDGHEVSVLSSQPSYKGHVKISKQPACEELDGMTIHRLSLLREANRSVLFRLLNMFYFPLRILLFIILKGKFDMVMISTAPPVVVGLAAALGVKIRGGDFIYHCMDIHPEIGAISGEFRNPLVFRALRALDTFTCNSAKAIVVLSTDMKSAIESRPGFKSGNIVVINNFSMPHHDEAKLVDSELLKKTGKFRLLFAGNLGRFQGLEVFVDAMQQLSHIPEIELVFLGEGNALASLKQRAHGMGNVIFLSHQPVSVARSVMSDADLGIVSLNKDIYKYAYPSKTMTYLDEGSPVLVSVENNSDLASFVTGKNVGVCVDIGSPQSISESVETLFRDKGRIAQMKSAAKQVSDECFSETVVLDKWSKLVKGCAG